MITLLKESASMPVTTKLLITANCRTYEEFDGPDEGAHLKYEMSIEDADIMNRFEESEEKSIGESLTPPQAIKVESAVISNAYFEDEEDYESGRIEITITMKSEQTISDTDLPYIAECALADISDNLEAIVRGTYDYVEEYVDYTKDDYRGERMSTAEMLEHTPISHVITNIKCERL